MYAATVTIGTTTWICDVATTSAELTEGLGGRGNLPAGHGMLFDMGEEKSQITINMGEMLFPLDIVFFDNDLKVRAVLWAQEPGDDYNATFPTGPGARYFLEVNAGEMVGVLIDDPAVITGWTPPAPPAPPIDMGEIMNLMVTMMIVVMMMKMMGGMMEGVS